MSWLETYRQPSGRFGVKGPFYGPQGHRGADYRMGRGGSIPAYEHGRVVLRGYSTVLGFYLVVQNDDGTYSGWAHLINESRLPVGTEVWAGTTIGAAAGAGDLPGSAWSGAHIHTTFGPRESSIYSGDVWDPTPRIDSARASTASSGAAITPIEEEDMTPEQAAMLKEVHDELVSGGTGGSKGWAKGQLNYIVGQLNGTGTHESGSLREALKYSIPMLPDVKAALDGGKFSDGHLPAIARFLADPAGIDTAALAAALAPALDVSKLSDREYTELAKRVNDEADRRNNITRP